MTLTDDEAQRILFYLKLFDCEDCGGVDCAECENCDGTGKEAGPVITLIESRIGT